MDKRGQFYLVAAMVIIVLIVGFAAIQNYIKKQSTVKLYDVKEELGIEGGKVLDYGTFNVEDEQEREDLIKDFSEDYIAYAGEGRNLYLIFGSYDKVFMITYEEVISGEIDIVTGEQGRSRLDIIAERIEITELEVTRDQGERKVEVVIGDITYEFELMPGQNFYFIISQEVGGEQHVVIS